MATDGHLGTDQLVPASLHTHRHQTPATYSRAYGSVVMCAGSYLVTCDVVSGVTTAPVYFSIATALRCTV